MKKKSRRHHGYIILTAVIDMDKIRNRSVAKLGGGSFKELEHYFPKIRFPFDRTPIAYFPLNGSENSKSEFISLTNFWIKMYSKSSHIKTNPVMIVSVTFPMSDIGQNNFVG